MPILIKSSNGERKVEIVSRNTEKKPCRDQDLRSTLVSLLRGMTINLELKINDVLIASSDAPIKVEESIGKRADVEQPVKLENMAQPESDKPKEQLKQVPLKSLESKNEESAQKIEPASIEAKPGLRFAPIRALKIKPEFVAPPITPHQPIVKIETRAAVEDEAHEANLPGESKTRVVPTPVVPAAVAPAPFVPAPVAPRSIVPEPIVPEPIKLETIVPEPMQQTKLSAKPINKPPEVASSNKPFLVRGDLKVGSAVTTVGLSIASEDPIVLYVTYDQKKLVESVMKIQEIADAIESQSMIKSVDIGDIIFGKSNEDDTWYRGIVMSSGGQQIEVYFFDWGITETLDITRIRRLTELGLGLAKYPACAVKVKFTDESKAYLGDVLDCEKRFSMRVEAYDQDKEVYTATVTKILADE